jgi:hypothetical protein
LLKTLTHRLRKRQIENFLENSLAWYKACTTVCRICGDALDDEDICDSDIGVALDKADRGIFQLRDNIGGMCRYMQGSNVALVKRVKHISEQVVRLRNQTSRFLIRCQGPISPAIVDRGEQRRLHYQRALEDFGLEARQMHREIDEELKTVWREMQSLRLEAERLVTG